MRWHIYVANMLRPNKCTVCFPIDTHAIGVQPINGAAHANLES